MLKISKYGMFLFFFVDAYNVNNYPAAFHQWHMECTQYCILETIAT